MAPYWLTPDPTQTLPGQVNSMVMVSAPSALTSLRLTWYRKVASDNRPVNATSSKSSTAGAGAGGATVGAGTGASVGAAKGASVVGAATGASVGVVGVATDPASNVTSCTPYPWWNPKLLLDPKAAIKVLLASAVMVYSPSSTSSLVNVKMVLPLACCRLVLMRVWLGCSLMVLPFLAVILYLRTVLSAGLPITTSPLTIPVPVGLTPTATQAVCGTVYRIVIVS
mmetsp:Transcript_45308/g.109691  ORF Transcript_45308/g.109691 Transcript_45308/m.109691 type:complete len:225 (-) Transcript_45308:209-883(-)